jgi:hypothetical protein
MPIQLVERRSFPSAAFGRNQIQIIATPSVGTSSSLAGYVG